VAGLESVRKDKSHGSMHLKLHKWMDLRIARFAC